MSIASFVPEMIRRAARKARPFLLSLDLPRKAEYTQPAEEGEACRDFSLIIAVHDAPEVTARCLQSIERFAANAEVILVDDGSREQLTKDLLQTFSQRYGWALVVHDQPKGHSRACEGGAECATRPYLCLLNSDTYVTPWGWKAIRETFGNQMVAVIGPSTSWATTEQRIVRAMHCRHYWTDSQIVGYARRYLDGLTGPLQVELPEISGFAFFIRRDLWVQFGGFDKDLHDYGNESELCDRLNRAGWLLIWQRNAYIHHFGEQSYSMGGSDFIEQRKREVRVFLDNRLKQGVKD